MNQTATSPLSLQSVHQAAHRISREERQRRADGWWRRGTAALLLLSPLGGCAAGVFLAVRGAASSSDPWGLLPVLALFGGLLLGAGYLASLALVSIVARKSTLWLRFALACVGALPMAGALFAIWRVST